MGERPTRWGTRWGVCQDVAVRLVARLDGTHEDVRRLLAAGLPDELTEIDYDRVALTVEVEGDSDDEEALYVAGRTLRATVDRINGLLRLMGGMGFHGLMMDRVEVLQGDERRSFQHFDPGRGWMIFADDRLIAPDSLEEIRLLNFSSVGELAAKDVEVARALRLFDLMVNRLEFDWSAAYSAWEVVREDARVRGLNPVKLGWWTAEERTAFTGTANSVHLLGDRARHGKQYGPPPRRAMREDESFWFLRRVFARWLAHRLASEQGY